MAAIRCPITVETNILTDSISEIQQVHLALAKCHGLEYRNLDRRIEALLDTGSDFVKIHTVGSALVAAPSGEFTQILQEARRLGVLK